MVDQTQAAAISEDRGPSAALITVVALATGSLVANLYYAQPLVASIGPAIGLSPNIAGSIVSITQIGYGLGLFLLVSLADLVENRLLVLATLSCTVIGLIGAAVSTSALPFFAASLLIGLSSTGAQVLLPFIAHLVPAAQRGRVVGNIMGGLLTGIMLARPVSLFIAASFGWRAVFWCSAVLMVFIGLALARMMPRHKPHGGMHYGQILASIFTLVRDLPAVRWRAAYQLFLFAAFNLFWTASPLMLAERFGMSEHGIALFALAGAGGAFAAPIAGRLADRGLSRATTAGAMLTIALAFWATGWAAAALAIAVLVVLAVIIDGAVQANQVVSQRIIFSVPPQVRGRVNAFYMTCTFIGGAIGSVLGTLTYHWGGWTATAIVGGSMGAFALLLFFLELGRARVVPV
ncbi:MFS transporter [Labrys miyagiensis]|uniref:MFS transporter n=1 Tax=Labrys miyagiensis TaxID=346912 RepID=A0ABQ6CQM8_9HYPH|nr:MFS transporter [Labrys miyagiensis]GLS22464.1 MFS transporter [Labrys miyagiensis]